MPIAKDSYGKIFDLLERHHSWFRENLPLIASENVPSPAVREAIVSDFGNRYAEGWPGQRVYAGCTYIDEVETLCADLARRVFKAEFADVRPISGVCANLSVYSAFTTPGDLMLALAIPNGGHISSGRMNFSGTAGLVHGLQIEYFAFDSVEMNIDVEKTKTKIKKLIDDGKSPKMAMFGGSLFLFPQPIRELVDFLKSYDILVCYDSAHVSGLIAGGQFQDPLREGAEVMTLSTHKTFFGPQGGIVLSRDKYSEEIKKAVFPGNTSNHHLHTVAGKAVALAETLRFGSEYARQVIRNAKELASSLHDMGIRVLGEKNGFTSSHQVVMDVTTQGDGGSFEKELERANVIVNRQLIPGDISAGRHYLHPGGIRIGTQEVTRLGMKELEMKEIAEFIGRVVLKHEKAKIIKKDVKTFRESYQKIHFAFDTKEEAYKYIRIR